MPAAAVPIAASLAAPAAGTALTAAVPALAAASVPSFIAPALGGALTGGLGAYIMGQDPMKGALFGGLGGGLSHAAEGFLGLGDAAKGAAGLSPEAIKAGVSPGIGQAVNAAGDSVAIGSPAMANFGIPQANGSLDISKADMLRAAGNTAGGASAAASKAAETGSLTAFMKNNPIATGIGTGLISMALNKATAVPTNDIKSKISDDYRKPNPMTREYTPVDPQNFATNSSQRYFYKDVNPTTTFAANGGSISKYAKGGISRYIQGQGDGLSDDIPAQLSDGEFVVSAPVVSALGNGSNKAGAKKLNALQKNVKMRHFSGGKPKKAMGLGAYMH